jgi:uncharacterized membrane protein YphA (DoxX/SURF4 family)
MFLNFLPQLFTYSQYMPTLLRIVVAGVFVYLLIHHFKYKKTVAGEIEDKFKWISHEASIWLAGLLIIAELAVAALFFVGAWTQVAAILAALGFVKMALLNESLPTYAPFTRLSYVLLVAICISLLFTGAGMLAFDIQRL